MITPDNSTISKSHISLHRLADEDPGANRNARLVGGIQQPKLGDFARVLDCLQDRERHALALKNENPPLVDSSSLHKANGVIHSHGSRNGTVKLGDFGRVQSSILKKYVGHESHPSAPLDNYSTLFDARLHPAELCCLPTLHGSVDNHCHSRKDDSVVQPRPATNGHAGDASGRKSDPSVSAYQSHYIRHTSVSSLDAKADVGAMGPEEAGILTPASTPPTSVSPELHDNCKRTIVSHKTIPNVQMQQESCRLGVGKILSYRLIKHGQAIPIMGVLRSTEKQHESLCLKLIAVRAEDASVAARNPQTAANGVHVFLDMSNIHISFHQALRNKYPIPDHARFAPLPLLNLEFLSELLIRERRLISLNAGCSMQPDRHEPRYVQDLRGLGYRVDLRERKRTSEPKTQRYGKQWSGDSSSDEISTGRLPVRYVEDLVDETLQTRIAESVMECFQHQGTLIFATGDAKPAKYSDGFFAYAQRALRMGWNVEVVSWKGSLSSQWRDPGWSRHWGEQFRIVTLDDYLDDLLTPEGNN